jgi:hypothetical protein
MSLLLASFILMFPFAITLLMSILPMKASPEPESVFESLAAIIGLTALVIHAISRIRAIVSGRDRPV